MLEDDVYLLTSFYVVVGRSYYEYVVTAYQKLHAHLCALCSGNMMNGSSCWLMARKFVFRRRMFSVSILLFLQLISFSEGKKNYFIGCLL
jgi:hypothetical protein